MLSDFKVTVEKVALKRRHVVYERLIDKKRRLQMEWIQKLGTEEEVVFDTPLSENQQTEKELQEFILSLNLNLSRLKAGDYVWRRKRGSDAFSKVMILDTCQVHGDKWWYLDTMRSVEVPILHIDLHLSKLRYLPQLLGELDEQQTKELYKHVFELEHQIRFFV